MVMANEPPLVPEGGLTHIFVGPCSDQETGEKGTCVMSQDKDGNYFTSFWQDGVMMFIRKPVVGGYETVWENDQYRGI
jgi:hypothetical protein